ALGGCPKATGKPENIKVAASCWTDPTAEIPGGGPGRQTGSSFKAFTLAAALEQGISPSKVYPAPRVYVKPHCNSRVPKDCQPIGNAEGEGGGSRTLRQATAESVNTVFVQV